MSHRPNPDIHAMVAELCRPQRHSETYEAHVNGTTWHRRHTIRTPSLLHQLQHASPSGRGTDRSTGYGSRPAALLEALDTLTRIDHESSRWLRVTFHLDDPGDTAQCVTLLGSLYPSLEQETQRRALEHDIRSWWTQARVVTGWDVAPFRPDNTCPACTKRGALRIRVFDAYDTSAFCVECRTSWPPTMIGLLAEHIRLENHEDTSDTTTSESA